MQNQQPRNQTHSPLPEGRRYNPSDVYAPLVEKKATQEGLIKLLFRRTAPFLPTHVLTPNPERFRRIDAVQRLFKELENRYADVLDSHKKSRSVAVKVNSGIYTSVPEICENIADGSTRNTVFEELIRIRDASTCDFLAAIGFEPPQDVQGTADASGKDSERFRFYYESADSNNDAVQPVDEMGEEKLRSAIKDMKLRDWIGRTNGEFQKCVAEAFEFLSQSIKPIAPHGIKGQAFGMITDLGTQSFAGLLTIIFNKKSDLNRRFEALRLLEWAIAFYSIKTNPVFKAQQKVRAEIHEKFQMFLWASDGEFLPMAVPGEELERIMTEEEVPAELRRHETSNINEAVELTSRKLGNKARRVISDFREHVVHTDRLMLETRGKTHQAAAGKLFFSYREINEARATLAGMQTSMTSEKAESIVDKYKRLSNDKYKKSLEDEGRHEEVFNVKPISFDLLDDQVGGTLIVALAKPINEITEGEKPKVLNMFSSLADFVAMRLGLSNVKKESDALFAPNRDNTHSSGEFRAYKVHGTITVKVPGHANSTVPIDLDVPVEIQLLPLETYVRGKLPGKSGHSNYRARRIEDMGVLLMPESIGCVDLYANINQSSASQQAAENGVTK